MATTRTLAAALILSILISPDQAHAFTGGEMQQRCRRVLDTQQSVSVPPGQVFFVNDFGAGLCWGAVTALQSAVVLYDPSVGDKPALGACPPPGSTAMQLVRVFDRYATEHPERHHIEAADLIIEAWRTYFPCTATGTAKYP